MNPTRAMQQIRLYLLGAFRLERDSQPIHLPTRKVESLFAYLALHPEVHLREKLAALLWGDSTDEQARHSLRTALATIRKELGDEVIFADRETIQLDPDFPLWTDTGELERLAVIDPHLAIELYCGDLLPDFYDDWIPPEREHFRSLYHTTLLALAQKARSESKYTQAIEWAHKVLSNDPANEKAYQHIIFCLAATGDRIGALKQYDECEKKLRNELGVEPSKETVTLRGQIEEALTGAPSRDAQLTNLPNPLTSFVGRESEQWELKELCEKTRLLTLTGAGGCGKTRLAIQVARDVLPSFKHGVWWVELAALSDPALVPQAVAQVLGVQESREQSLTEMLSSFIRDKPMLVALDNCEHLITACAELAEKLLLTCPNLKIIATGREALNVTGETAWRVPSLALPDLAHLPSANELALFDAIQLFIQRASAVEPNWKLDGNASAVAQICEQLDGIPLALELAAARVKSLSVEQIAARLDDRFRLLTGGSRTALPRHHTLRAAIDWSHSLLTAEERVLFRRLSVFAGGWTLEAAQAVCGCDPVCPEDVLDLLARLVDKSLIIFDQRASQARYRLMETIRQYALDKLLEADEAETVRGQHLGYYLELAQTAEPKLHGAEQFVWLDILEREHNNLRAALEFSKGDGRVEKGLELAAALLEFWELSAGWSEARELVANLLNHPKAAARNLNRANGLLAAATIQLNLGDLGASRWYLEELVDIARELGEPGKKLLALGLGHLGFNLFGDNPSRGESLIEEGLAIARLLGTQWVIARLLWMKGRCLVGRRDVPAARKAFEEALLLFQSIGDKRNAAFSMSRIGGMISRQHDNATARRYHEQALLFARETKDREGISTTLNQLGEIERVEGKYGLAKRDYLEALEIAREISRMGLAVMCLNNLGAVALHEGDMDSAKTFLAEALVLGRELNRHAQIPFALMGFAGMLAMERKTEQAAQLLALVQTFRRSGDLRTWDSADEQAYEHYLTLTREQLDEATFNAAWAEGQKMTLEQAAEYALDSMK